MEADEGLNNTATWEGSFAWKVGKAMQVLEGVCGGQKKHGRLVGGYRSLPLGFIRLQRVSPKSVNQLPPGMSSVGASMSARMSVHVCMKDKPSHAPVVL